MPRQIGVEIGQEIDAIENGKPFSSEEDVQKRAEQLWGVIKDEDVRGIFEIINHFRIRATLPAARGKGSDVTGLLMSFYSLLKQKALDDDKWIRGGSWVKNIPPVPSNSYVRGVDATQDLVHDILQETKAILDGKRFDSQADMEQSAEHLWSAIKDRDERSISSLIGIFLIRAKLSANQGKDPEAIEVIMAFYSLLKQKAIADGKWVDRPERSEDRDI